jgi:D-amino-acid dehydrogenase
MLVTCPGWAVEANFMGEACLVLGAGIVGVSVALHLQKRGRSVVLVDRRGEPGAETSYGNAGLIQREAVYPYGFPRDLSQLFKYALNRSIDARYHWSAIPKIAPFLARYWWHSRPKRHDAIARLYAPLIAQCVPEHDSLAAEAGAEHLIRHDGWMKVFRTKAAMNAVAAEAEGWRREFGVTFDVLDGAALAQAEPHLMGGLAGAIRWTQPSSVRDPQALTRAYVVLFERLGGRFVVGDALRLAQDGAGWRVPTDDGEISAPDVVVALGPWSDDLANRLGYRIPFAVKRGYHMHYRPAGNAVLNNWTLDVERGYFIMPMNRGIRLTTGAEFALRDAPKTPVQLDAAEQIAREFFPDLGHRLDPEPWMGARPCTPDMLPVIGKAPRHGGLWFAFGHAHHGLTLGPATGRLIAEMMTGETPYIDPSAFSPARF